MKKNIVIIILSLVILGLGGYLVYDKVIDKDEKKVEKNEEIKTEDYDLVLAKELVDKYYTEYQAGSTFDSMTEQDMMRNVFDKAKEEEYNCTELYKTDDRATAQSQSDDSSEIFSYVVEYEKEKIAICDKSFSHIVTYDNFNKLYKELYGKDLEAKKDTFYMEGRAFGYYDSKNDLFALSAPRGGSGYMEKKFYDVKSAKIVEEQLIIDIGYKIFESCFDNDSVGEKYCGMLNNKYITYNISMDEKSFVSENLKYFDTYRFIFNKEDDHYVLDSYVKILK